MKRASLNTGVEPGGQVHQRPAPTAPSPSVLLRPARPLTAPNLVALGIRVKEKGELDEPLTLFCSYFLSSKLNGFKYIYSPKQCLFRALPVLPAAAEGSRSTHPVFGRHPLHGALAPRARSP